MKPKTRVKIAVALLVLCVIAWPITSLTCFKGEPQGVLALSWLALILTFVDIVVTADVRNQQ
jgi:hypothetical protein